MDIRAGHWKQLKGKSTEQWGKRTDDDFDILKYSRDRLAGNIQKVTEGPKMLWINKSNTGYVGQTMSALLPTNVPEPLIRQSFRDTPTVAATPEEGGVDDPAFAAAEPEPPATLTADPVPPDRLSLFARLKHLVFGEHSLTKVAGLFASLSLAENAAHRLQQEAGFDEARVRILGPTDTAGLRRGALSRSLEPEQAGIWHTVVRAHLFTGSVGLALALLVYAGFLLNGHPAVTSTPGISLVAILFIGGVLGLMVGGLLSMRPDHYRVLVAVRRALRKEQWAVIAHPVTPREVKQAISEMRLHSYRVVRSI